MIRYLTMLDRLLNIFKQNKKLYITGALLLVLPFIIRVILPHLDFLCTFLSFSGGCTIIYGLLLYFQKSKSKALSVTATVCKITAWVLIIAFLVSFAVIEVKIISAAHTTDESCDYILVLGCSVNGTELTRAARARADAAIEYLNKNPECTAILCGGQGKGDEISEAEAYYNYMVKNGIDSNRLIKEERSKDTRQNINFAKEYLPDVKGLSVAVVTNDFHLYRSTVIMEKAGFTDIHCVNGPTPNVPFLHLSLYLREYFSVMLEYLNI